MLNRFLYYPPTRLLYSRNFGFLLCEFNVDLHSYRIIHIFASWQQNRTICYLESSISRATAKKSDFLVSCLPFLTIACKASLFLHFEGFNLPFPAPQPYPPRTRLTKRANIPIYLVYTLSFLSHSLHNLPR